MKRIKRIFDVFGIYYGIKYAIAYQLHRCCYIKRLAKRVIRLKYKGTDLYVRLFSRDLDFLESIYIGRYSQGGWQGEYDLGGGEKDCLAYLDLGANIGLFTVMFAKQNPDKQFISVEPEKSNFQLLRKNTKTLKNVICINRGVWYRNTYTRIHESDVLVGIGKTPSEGGFYIEECDKESSDAKTVTIDCILKKYGLKDVLVKMDIEGAEYGIFMKGSTNWIKDCKTLVLETHDRFSECYDEQEIFAVLEHSHRWKRKLGENLIFVRKHEKL